MSRPKHVRKGIHTGRFPSGRSHAVRNYAVRIVAAVAVAAPVAVAGPAEAAPPPPPCLASDLALSWASGGTAVPGGGTPGTEKTALVALRNLARVTCMLDGFPKVTLVQGDRTQTLAKAPVAHSAVTVEPGTAARFTLTFKSARAGEEGAIEPVTAVVTPPNNTASKNLRWPWGQVAEQGSGTRLVNFVSPAHN
ncbi:DUF4232 domain-containing protein [Streptomyces sp. NPDC057445]|uniref:DUF4232 domain-containing protein n=1 Tax=Streptomyces sp. NPDC057445 TaxID=3346136 RepID=UPI0036989C8E